MKCLKLLGIAQLGKDFDDSTYGWDIDYGSRTVEVAPFLASKYLITNSEFLDFVKAGGYGNQEYWDEKSWQWKTENNIQHPKFWISQNGSYKYRAQFDEIDLPLDRLWKSIIMKQWLIVVGKVKILV